MTIPAPSGTSSRRGLHRVVVEALGLRIVRGDLAAGQTLPPEDDLSAELGVSRTVVREAIMVLAAKGLVESRPRVGTRALARAHIQRSGGTRDRTGPILRVAPDHLPR
jgi:DNA-binding FadR family transcriptional regulator